MAFYLYKTNLNEKINSHFQKALVPTLYEIRKGKKGKEGTKEERKEGKEARKTEGRNRKKGGMKEGKKQVRRKEGKREKRRLVETLELVSVTEAHLYL